MRCLELSESVHHRDPRVHVQIFLSSGMLMSLPLQKTKDHTEVKAFSLSERQKSSLLQKVKVQPLKTRRRKKKRIAKRVGYFSHPFSHEPNKKKKDKKRFPIITNLKVHPNVDDDIRTTCNRCRNRRGADSLRLGTGSRRPHQG